jgi:protein-disulfide isomerase
MSTQGHLKIPVSEKDHSEGPDSAALTVIEYGDYQCPYCGRAYPIVKRLQKALGAKMKFVFRNFPLSELHPDALNAAKIAEAAAQQGKFWEMHDALYENQQAMDMESLVGYAATIGLDMDKLNAEWVDPAIEDRISSDFEGGVRSGVNGTPTFFVNGVRYDGDWSYAPFLKALEEMI